MGDVDCATHLDVGMISYMSHPCEDCHGQSTHVRFVFATVETNSSVGRRVVARAFTAAGLSPAPAGVQGSLRDAS